MILLRPVVLLAVLLMHMCSPVGTLNALAPMGAVSVVRDLPYAAGPRHGLDVYAPRQPIAGAPVLVFFYGGGWETGAKAMYRFVGASLAQRGVVVVIPDYRLHPAVRFPAFMDDAAAAVAWTRANAARFGGDPHRLFLMGHSAGGQIAALLALAPDYLASVHLSPQRDLCGVIGLAGAYDFQPRDRAAFAAIFGDEAAWPRARPINYVTPHAPPMLLLSGSVDGAVEPGNTTRLAERLRAAGDVVMVRIVPDLSHTAIIAALSRPFEFLAPVRAATLQFIARQTACGAS
jgi:acetyl esterase/lipase